MSWWVVLRAVPTTDGRLVKLVGVIGAIGWCKVQIAIWVTEDGTLEVMVGWVNQHGFFEPTAHLQSLFAALGAEMDDAEEEAWGDDPEDEEDWEHEVPVSEMDTAVPPAGGPGVWQPPSSAASSSEWSALSSTSLLVPSTGSSSSGPPAATPADDTRSEASSAGATAFSRMDLGPHDD